MAEIIAYLYLNKKNTVFFFGSILFWREVVYNCTLFLINADLKPVLYK